MKRERYVVTVNFGTYSKVFYSNSRNAKKHLTDYGANECLVSLNLKKKTRLISIAVFDVEKNKPVSVNCCWPGGENDENWFL